MSTSALLRAAPLRPPLFAAKMGAFGATMSAQQNRSYHKWQKRASPRRDRLVDILYTNFNPVHCEVKNNLRMGPWLWDEHFLVKLVSPRFEDQAGGLPAHRQLVRDVLTESGFEPERVQFKGLRPPSQWNIARYETRFKAWMAHKYDS